MRNAETLAAALAVAASVIPMTAHAATCRGVVKEVHVGSQATVSLTMEGATFSFAAGAICSLRHILRHEIHGEISPETCRAWLSLAQGAMLSGREVALELSGNTCPNGAAWFSVFEAPYGFYHMIAR